jgi:hypothetical protein
MTWTKEMKTIKIRQRDCPHPSTDIKGPSARTPTYPTYPSKLPPPLSENALAQTSKMCYGFVREHTQCHHRSDFIITSECAAGSQHGVCRDGCAEIIYTKFTDQPSFCPDCYRHAERNICESFDEEIDSLNHRIHKTEQASFKARSGFEQRGFEDELHRLDTLLRDLRQERKSELRAFRKDNKVWGDG